MCRGEDPQEMALWSQKDQGTSGNTDFPFLPSLVDTSASGSSSSGTPASLPLRWIQTSWLEHCGVTSELGMSEEPPRPWG